MFVVHTEETAPAQSKGALAHAKKTFGFIPDALARMAASPHLVDAFMQAIARFDKTSLSPLEREIVVLTLAREIGCEVCEALHTRTVDALGHAGLAQAIRAQEALPDPRLDALSRFTVRVLATRGAASEEDLAGFFSSGYDTSVALDLVLGIGAYTMSMYANRLTRANVDPAFR